MNSGGRSLFRVSTFMVLTMPLLLGQVNATQGQSQTQTTADTAPVLEVEVATIKLNKSGAPFALSYTPDGFTATNYTLQGLIRKAYVVNDSQISGGPGWLKSETYDIDAKFDKAAADALQKLSPEQIRRARQRMAQRMLEDRFQLKYHRETRELPVYALVIAKNGPKLQESKPRETNGIKGPDGLAGAMRLGRDYLAAQGVPLSLVARDLGQALGRTVVDKTGLKGNYDFILRWVPDVQSPMFSGAGDGNQGPPAKAPMPDSGPTIFTAIQEQLGLKLEAQKGPMEVLVIDHVERPSEN